MAMSDQANNPANGPVAVAGPMAALWAALREQVPELLPAEPPGDAEAAARAGEALGEMARALLALEAHVHHMLSDLRRVSEQNDPLNHFYVMLTENPGLSEALRDFLVKGRRERGNFVNLLRAVQAWTRAFSSGLRKVLIRSPALIADELNPRQWPLSGSMLLTEDAKIGKYLKETGLKALPEKLGTLFHQHAGRYAYEDYTNLMRMR